jgi:hypothetical protein
VRAGRRYLGGIGEVALEGFLLLRESPLSAGLELALGGLLLGVLSKAPGVSEAPGVPGVRSVAAPDGETGGPSGGPPPPGGVAWAHVVAASNTASGKAAKETIGLYMGSTLHEAPHCQIAASSPNAGRTR